jgi:putative copper export protein
VNDAVGLLDAVYAAARWGWYLTAFFLVGAGSYAPYFFGPRSLHGSHPELAADLTRRAARLGRVAAVALLAFAGLRLYLQARTLIDPTETVNAEFLRTVLGTSWGTGWIRQTALGLIAGIAFAATGGASRLAWLAAALASAGVVLTAGMTGHANTAAGGRGGILIDAAHLLAGGLWLGGLAVMFVAGLGACRSLPAGERALVLRALVADFSRRALVFAPLTVAFGVWLAARYLGWSWPLHLGGSSYGLVLAGKLLVLGGVAGLGAYNWRITQPKLTHPGGETRLRRFSALELLFGVILLGITAVLVALPLPEGRM